jgi:hypothetical protein
MPRYARFKQNAGSQPDLNIPGLVAAIGGEAGEISRDIYMKGFSDNVPRDVVDIVFPIYGGEVIGVPTESLHLADTVEELPAWE